MINSVMTIGGHLTDRILCDSKGSALDLPNLFPSLYQFRLKLIDFDPTGTSIQVYPNVTNISASIGLVYAEPRAGTFKLRYGSGTTTEAIDFKESAEDFRTKLAVLTESTTYGLDVVYQPTPSTWVCRFLTPPTDPGPPIVIEDILLNGYENELEPETFIRIRQFTQNAETWVEVRLIQGPVASTSGLDTILGAAPTVRTIRDGFTEDDGLTVIIVNEIQAITVPPDFTGTYFVKYQGRQSTALSATDGPQNIQTAMNQMYHDTVTRFAVTNPEVNNAYVEFVGPFSGMNMDQLQVAVASHGLADYFFQLNLFTTEVAEALQRNPSVEAFFEVRLHITDGSTTDPGQDLVLFQAPVTIVRPLHWEGLEESTPINWLFPPNPKDYIPFTLDQAGFGAVNYSIPFGDGALHDYVITHNLNTSNLQVSVRHNTAPGLQLTDEEFTVSFTNNNALSIHIVGAAPASNSLIAVILSSGIENVFSPHTHTIDQIVDLRALLNSILGRLAALEALLPSLIGITPGPSPFGTAADAEILGVKIPDEYDLIPTNRPPIDKFDPLKLPPPGLLLPAVHNVINLGAFTADPATDEITLVTAYTGTPPLVAGQRARIYTPLFYDTTILVTFDSTAGVDLVHAPAHTLVNGRRIKFSGAKLPTAISPYTVYYVVSSILGFSFQIAATIGGDPIALLDDGDTADHHLWTISELPGGLLDSVDYFMLSPTSTVFQLAATIGGSAIDITSAGYQDLVSPLTMSTVEEQPFTGILPDPVGYAGNAYSVRGDIFLRGGRGIRSETVHEGDLIASDGRVWYHVTRSDSPGSNSFYPAPMEKEIFRIAVNQNMLPAGTIFTLTFDLSLQMFRHDCNIQYLLVIELADLLETTLPSPTGPNLFEVLWNKTPLMQQKIIVTDTYMTHHFGTQVIHKTDGTLRTNKKQYGVEIAGDIIPSTPNFGMRVRLIEFDTEDNIDDAEGLVYYLMAKASSGVSLSTPAAPVATTPLP